MCILGHMELEAQLLMPLVYVEITSVAGIVIISTSTFYFQTNTFQSVLITDGTKSYAVYTYQCGEMEWGDESTIGFNAGQDYYENHPVTGHFQSHFIACLQNISAESLITNVIYDLVPDVIALLPGVIPPTHNTIGIPNSPTHPHTNINTSQLYMHTSYSSLSSPRFMLCSWIH